MSRQARRACCPPAAEVRLGPASVGIPTLMRSMRLHPVDGALICMERDNLTPERPATMPRHPPGSGCASWLRPVRSLPWRDRAADRRWASPWSRSATTGWTGPPSGECCRPAWTGTWGWWSAAAGRRLPQRRVPARRLGHRRRRLARRPGPGRGPAHAGAGGPARPRRGARGVAMAAWALAWCLQHPAVSCVVAGCKSVEQVAVQRGSGGPRPGRGRPSPGDAAISGNRHDRATRPPRGVARAARVARRPARRARRRRRGRTGRRRSGAARRWPGGWSVGRRGGGGRSWRRRRRRRR